MFSRLLYKIETKFNRLINFVRNIFQYRTFLTHDQPLDLISILLLLKTKLSHQRRELPKVFEVDNTVLKQIDDILNSIDIFFDLTLDPKYKELDQNANLLSKEFDDLVSKLKQKYPALVDEFEEQSSPNVLPLEYNLSHFLDAYQDKIGLEDSAKAATLHMRYMNSLRELSEYEDKLRQELLRTIFCELADNFIEFM